MAAAKRRSQILVLFYFKRHSVSEFAIVRAIRYARARTNLSVAPDCTTLGSPPRRCHVWPRHVVVGEHGASALVAVAISQMTALTNAFLTHLIHSEHLASPCTRHARARRAAVSERVGLGAF